MVIDTISLVLELIDLNCYVVDTMSDENLDAWAGVSKMPVNAADDFDEIYKNVLRIRAEQALAKKVCRKCGERIGQPHQSDCGYCGNVWEAECD